MNNYKKFLELKKQIKKYAEGGKVKQMPYKELISEHEKLVKDLEGPKEQYHEQKRELAQYKKEAHMADGGEVNNDDISQQLQEFAKLGQPKDYQPTPEELQRYKMALQAGTMSGGVKDITSPGSPSLVDLFEKLNKQKQVEDARKIIEAAKARASIVRPDVGMGRNELLEAYKRYVNPVEGKQLAPLPKGMEIPSEAEKMFSDPEASQQIIDYLKNKELLRQSLEKATSPESLEQVKKSGMADGGQVQESQQKQYQAKEYFGKGANGPGERVANSQGIAMTAGYSDGGKIIEDSTEAQQKLRTYNTENYDPETVYHEVGKIGRFKYPMPAFTEPAFEKPGTRHTINLAMGGPVSIGPGAPQPAAIGNTSANTVKSLSPLLKESYAGPQKKKKPKKMSDGGFAAEQVPKQVHPLGSPNVHAPVEKKYPMNIPKAPGLKIPKRLKSLEFIRGYQDGGDVTPDTFDPETITGIVTKPATSMDVSRENPEDKALEQQISGEDLAAQLASGEDQTSSDQARQLAGMTLSKDEALPEEEQKADDEALEGKQPPEEEISEGEEEKAPPITPQMNMMDQLKQAQEYRSKAQLWNQLGAIAERGAAAYANIAPTQQEAYKTGMALAQQAVDDVEQQIKHQGDDPNSQISQNFRQYLEQFSGHPVDPNTTANSGKEVLPLVFKDFEAKQAAETRKQLLEDRDKERLEQMQMRLQTQRDIAKENLDMKKFLAELAAKEKAASQQEKSTEKKKSDQDKELSRTTQLLEQMRGSPAVSQAEKDIYSSDKADSLANLYPNPDQLSPQQVRLLAQEVGKIAAGGAATMEELKGITPDTFRGRLANVTQKFINSPTGANAGDFIKQYQDYTKALRKDAQKVIQDRYGRIIESKKHLLGDDNYGFLKDQYLNRFLPSEGSPSSTGGKTVVRKGYNAKTNQTQLIYSDGTSEIKDGKL